MYIYNGWLKSFVRSNFIFSQNYKKKILLKRFVSSNVMIYLSLGDLIKFLKLNFSYMGPDTDASISTN